MENRRRKITVLVFLLRLDKEDDTNAIYHDYITELASRVKKVHVVCLEKGLVSLPKNVVVKHLGKDKGVSSAVQVLAYQRYLLKFGGQIDVIYTIKNPPYTIISYPLAKVFAIPIITWYGHFQVTRQFKIMNALTTYGVSSDKTAYPIRTKKFRAVGHGINTKQFVPSKQKKENTILWIGRLSAVRKLEWLVEAVDILVHHYKQKKVKVVICGENTQKDKDYKKEIQELTKKKGIADHFEYPGWVKNKELVEYFSKAKVSVTMVELGGTGKTNMEAMASGVPLITCSKPLRDIITDYQDELFFAPGNTKEFALKLHGILGKNTKDREKIGLYLRKLMVDGYSIERFIDRLLGVFDLALKKKEKKILDL